MRDHFVREISARAAPVLRDRLLAPEFGQPRRQDARGRVRTTAGWEADHKVNNARRPGVRAGEARHGRQRGSARAEMHKQSTGNFHAFPRWGWMSCRGACALDGP